MELYKIEGTKKERRKKAGNIIHTFVPDEIIVEIFSRLPFTVCMRFQCVCKRFRDLISGRDFINLHITRYVPIIFLIHSPADAFNFIQHLSDYVSLNPDNGIDYFCSSPAMKLCHDGLIVERDLKYRPRDFIVLNPIHKKEQVEISVSGDIDCIEICGVFYHASLNEYCTLWEVTTGPPLNNKVQYKILNLGSQQVWREIKNTTTENRMIRDIRPALVNRYLYWVVEPQPYFRDKIQHYRRTLFDDDNEVNVEKPGDESDVDGNEDDDDNESDDNNEDNVEKPGDDDKCSKESDDEFEVVPRPVIMEFDTTTEGFEVIPCPVPDQQLEIWILEDRANKKWTNITRDDGSFFRRVPDATLVLQSCRQLFDYDLRLDRDGMSYLSYAPSRASLKSCKPEICILAEDPVKENRP